MRILQILLTSGIVLPLSLHALAEDSKQIPDKKTAGDSQEQPAPLPPAEGELLPLSPPGGEDALPPVPAGFKEVTMDEASAAKPPLNVMDWHGYLRFRSELDHGLDLGMGNHPTNYPRAGDDPLDRERLVSYPQFPASASRRSKSLAGANMRLRLEPTINISEDVRIHTQIDILDNLVMGSTPNAYPWNSYYPLAALSDSQVPPSAGSNSLVDSLRVKRAWGEVLTPAGTLLFGRMGFHWGLGMLRNDGGPFFLDRSAQVTQTDPFSPVGQCFECDFGTNVDAILFIAKIAGHYFAPMIQFSGEGPSRDPVMDAPLGGQPVDVDQLDDVSSWIMTVAKRDKPEDLRAALDRDEWVLNYGLFFEFRNQALEASTYYDPATSADKMGGAVTAADYNVRNLDAYIVDGWGRFLWKKLRLEFEVAGIFGSIGDTAVAPVLDADGKPVKTNSAIDLVQFGFVLQGDYMLLNDKLILGMEIGFASGDDSPGMGVRPLADRQFSHADGDDALENFRFNPDYRVDLILWREIVGTVTDALYFKPSLQYNISERFGTKVSAIYSSALYKASTRGKSNPLGLEFDADLFYFSGDKFHAGFSYGLLIPLSGMNYLGEDAQPGGSIEYQRDDDADIAHRLMARLVLHF